MSFFFVVERTVVVSIHKQRTEFCGERKVKLRNTYKILTQTVKNKKIDESSQKMTDFRRNNMMLYNLFNAVPSTKIFKILWIKEPKIIRNALIPQKQLLEQKIQTFKTVSYHL